MKTMGRIKSEWPDFEKNEDLALLIGLVLGDGHIESYPRSEGLEIALGTDKPLLISFTFDLVERVFHKCPAMAKQKTNCVKIRIYEKYIAKRLEVPTGNRRYSKQGIPGWIWKKRSFLINCLRGLYEAEASLSVHLPTCTYNFAFHNTSERLLRDVYMVLVKLGLHPEVRPVAIRIRRKDEVKYLCNLLSFRKY